nr:immunoglobulin light chain junction region [Macaca mulatta]
CQQRNNYPPTF